MLNRGDAGIGYLAGTGISLIVILLWWFAIRQDADFTTFVGTTTGIILSMALIYLAYWLTQSELEEDHIWAVSVWGAIGLAIPTLPILGIVLFGLDAALRIDSSILINIAAACAVIGALFGAVTELEDEHVRVLSLNRRNVVLNRVLRHDIRNDAGLLLMFAERLEDEFTAAGDELAEPIRRKTNEIINIIEIAKQVETIDGQKTPINIVEIVEEQVKTVQSSHPEAAIETDLPEEAWLHANEMLKTVIDNLLENAIEHNDQRPEVRISIRPPEAAAGRVEIRVADNGPGIPSTAVEVLSRRTMPAPADTPQQIGLGLWLVKWFVDSYDGELTIEDNTPRGTVVRITLPSTRAEAEHPSMLESVP